MNIDSEFQANAVSPFPGFLQLILTESQIYPIRAQIINITTYSLCV